MSETPCETNIRVVGLAASTILTLTNDATRGYACWAVPEAVDAAVGTADVVAGVPEVLEARNALRINAVHLMQLIRTDAHAAAAARCCGGSGVRLRRLQPCKKLDRIKTMSRSPSRRLS